MHPDISEVKDGFIWRWTQQSLELIVKSPLVWIFLISLMGLFSLAPVNLFFKALMGLWLMLVGLELCIASDLDKVNPKSLINIFVKATQGFFLQVYFKIISFTLMFGVFVLATLYGGEIQETSWITNLYWVYGLGFLALTGIGFQVFTHLYSRFFDSANKRLVNYKCKLASKVNYEVEVFLEVFIVLNIILVSLVFPLLGLMLYPISCAFVYVGFKEIFLNKDPNRLKALLEKEMKKYNLS